MIIMGKEKSYGYKNSSCLYMRMSNKMTTRSKRERITS